MRLILLKALVVVLAAVLLTADGRPAIGQDAAAPPTAVATTEPTTTDETAQIEAAIESYVAAFNARDAQKLASHWSPDGVYTSRTSGAQSVGRDAILAEFQALFAGDDVPTLAVATESIEFISPNVAVERGEATVSGGDDATVTRYQVVYVQRDGQWLVDRVTEDEVAEQASQYEHLQALEPLIGEWTYEGDAVAVEIACRWTSNQNYISRTFKITNTETGDVESSGLQVVGWDPLAQEIHSWMFDSDGGHVTGTWNQRDGKWVVTSIATLADGARGSFTTVLRPLDDGSVGWQKINQVVDGQLLPNIDEIVFVRK